MNTNQTIGNPKWMTWTGRVLTGLGGLFMLFDAVMKIMKPAPVVEGTVKMGFPEGSITGIGIALLVGTVLYLIPCTEVLGAIWITGFLGGAIAANVRVNAGLIGIISPLIVATVIWGGLFFRNQKLRTLIPWRR